MQPGRSSPRLVSLSAIAASFLPDRPAGGPPPSGTSMGRPPLGTSMGRRVPGKSSPRGIRPLRRPRTTMLRHARFARGSARTELEKPPFALSRLIAKRGAVSKGCEKDEALRTVRAERRRGRRRRIPMRFITVSHVGFQRVSFLSASIGPTDRICTHATLIALPTSCA